MEKKKKLNSTINYPQIVIICSKEPKDIYHYYNVEKLFEVPNKHIGISHINVPLIL